MGSVIALQMTMRMNPIDREPVHILDISMAERIMLRCVACGSLRNDAAFGLNTKGELENAPAYEPQRAVQTIGGRGRCSWAFSDVTPELAISLRAGLRAAAEAITAALQAAGVDDPDGVG